MQRQASGGAGGWAGGQPTTLKPTQGLLWQTGAAGPWPPADFVYCGPMGRRPWRESVAEIARNSGMAAKDSPLSREITIVGMSCRMPVSSGRPEAYWQRRSPSGQRALLRLCCHVNRRLLSP